MAKQICNVGVLLLLVLVSYEFASAQPPVVVKDLSSEFEDLASKAEGLERAKDWYGAIELYESFIKTHRDASRWVYEAIVRIARIIKQMQAKELEGALKQIERLKRLTDETLAGTLHHGLAYAEIGDTLVGMGCYGEARAIYERAIELRDGDWFTAWIKNKIARSYLMEGKLQEAVQMYEMVIAHHQEQAREIFRARVGLWQVGVMKGEFKGTSKALREAYEGLIEAEPNAHEWAYELMARAIFDVAKDVEEPSEWILETVRWIGDASSDAVAMCLNRIGYQFLAAKRYEDARRIFSIVVREYGTSKYASEACLRLGYLSLRDGRVNDAMYFLHRGLTAHHHTKYSLECGFVLGNLMLKHLHDELIIEEERLVEVAKGLIKVVQALRDKANGTSSDTLASAMLLAASLSMEVGDYEEVIKLCRDARLMNDVSKPIAARAMLKEAYALFRRGYVNRCEELLMSVVKQYPHAKREVSIARADIACIQAAQERINPETAIRITREALKSIPNTHPIAITLRRRIGMFYEKMGDYRRAIEEYSKIPPARGSDPAYDERTFVPIHLSKCWQRMGEWRKAVSVLQQAIRRWVDYPFLVKELRVHLELLLLQIPKDVNLPSIKE